MEEVVSKIKRGDQKAFRKLFESFFIPLRNYALHFISCELTAQDIAQETLIKYWDRRENFDHFNQVRSFLYLAVRNAAINELEHKNVTRNAYLNISEQLLHRTSEDDEMMAIREDVYRQLRDAIETLPERSKEILKLTLKGLKNEQIAQDLGISYETVKTLKRISYKKLREKIKTDFHFIFI
jgi:RNA polymerase sigma-70 factor (ECF subfamily)